MTGSDVAVNSTSAILVSSQTVEIVYGAPDEHLIMYQAVDVQGRAAGTWRSVDDMSTWGSPAPRADMNNQGAFAVAWVTNDWQFRDPVQARMFDPSGVPLGPTFQVSSGPYRGDSVAVAVDPSGGATFVWEYSTSENVSSIPSKDGSGGSIWARRYDNSGSALGPEFLVNTTTQGNQVDPDIAMAGDGAFVVVWAGTGGVFMQRYDASGNKAGSEVRLAAGAAASPQLAMAPDGRFVVVWQQPDGDGNGI